MSQKVTKNQRRFSGEVPSESVVKARGYRGERHCEKDAFSERRSQEGNRNCNNLQQVERGDDVVESGYFEFQNNQERKEILNQILRNDMISSETKKSCANKLYEVTNKMEHEESDDTLSSKGSNGKNSFPKNKKEILEQNQNNITKPKNINVNSYSKRNQKKKSRKISKSVSSKPERFFRSELGFNNNAEGYSPPKGRKQSSRFNDEIDRLEDETVEKLDEAKRNSEAMHRNAGFSKSPKFKRLNNWFQSHFVKSQKENQGDNLLKFDDDIDRLVDHTHKKMVRILGRMGNKKENDQMLKAVLDKAKKKSQTLHINAGFPESTKFKNCNTWIEGFDLDNKTKRFDEDLQRLQNEIQEKMDSILTRQKYKEENDQMLNQELESMVENAYRKVEIMHKNAGFPISKNLDNVKWWLHTLDLDDISRGPLKITKELPKIKKEERICRTKITNPIKKLPVRRSNMTKEETEQYERDCNRISKGPPYFLYLDRSKRNYTRIIPVGEDDDDVFE